MSIDVFHRLQGDSIFFKALDIKDSQGIHDYASDPVVSRFIGWRLMRSPDETRDFVAEMIRRESAGTHLYASVVSKETGRIIGTAMMFGFDGDARHAEVGYVLHKEHWGKGFGTETVKMLNEFSARELKLHKLHARVVDTNIGSYKILEKNGFVLEGRFKDYYFIEGAYYDGLFYGKILPAADGTEGFS